MDTLFSGTSAVCALRALLSPHIFPSDCFLPFPPRQGYPNLVVRCRFLFQPLISAPTSPTTAAPLSLIDQALCIADLFSFCDLSVPESLSCCCNAAQGCAVCHTAGRLRPGSFRSSVFSGDTVVFIEDCLFYHWLLLLLGFCERWRASS